MAKKRAENLRAQRLLLNALRHPEQLAALSTSDWDLLLRIARRTRLLGRLEVSLSDRELLAQVPACAANHLRATRNVIKHRQTLVAWEVDRLRWALREIDAPLILLKGAGYLLAELPPAAGRIFADVDLLVPEKRLDDIEAGLLTRGWFRTQIDPYDDRYYRVWMHELPPLRHCERGTEIDIHHRLLPKTSRLASPPDTLFATARSLANPRIQILAPTDMVLHALVHLFLEGDPEEGLRLRDLLDVHELLKHFDDSPDFWRELIPRARELGFQRPLYYGLHHAQQLFASPIPASMTMELAELAPPWPIKGLMETLINLALLPEHPDYPRRSAAIARWLLYARAHWLRMPTALLAKHLLRKLWLRFRGARKRIDLAQLDLKQQ